jgi:hypothetical protein
LYISNHASVEKYSYFSPTFYLINGLLCSIGLMEVKGKKRLTELPQDETSPPSEGSGEGKMKNT